MWLIEFFCKPSGEITGNEYENLMKPKGEHEEKNEGGIAIDSKKWSSER